MKITLKNNLQNVSLQVGDFAYFSTGFSTGSGGANGSHATAPELIGKITNIGLDYIEIDNVQNSNTLPDYPNTFLMFSKDTRVNKNSLIGYYAEIELENNSTDKIELFSLGSEVTQSSK
jgi:hypothetical protein|tara:strand:+ start:3016 stop:3372 length:357 start_codon:yes stop_codon:yes gene_type:complete